jgi:hypothetical protein
MKISLKPYSNSDFSLEPDSTSDLNLNTSHPGEQELNNFQIRDEKLNILDLFSGSGSWIEGWRKSTTYNVCIDSVDIIKKPHINYCMDIRDFKPDKKYHIVYASPPCTHFSQMRKINKLKTTDEELKEALLFAEIAFNFAKNAKFCYVIENPYTGSLKNYYPDCQMVDYSCYDFPMRKRTAIWSNIDLKLKIKIELNYNRLPLQYIKENAKIPKKLVDRIKWMIIKKFNKELKEFRK